MRDYLIELYRKIKKCKRNYDIKGKSNNAQNHYKELIDSIKSEKRTRLRFGAYVIFDSTYGISEVFEKMMQQAERWSVRIVVIPDISRGKEHKEKTYQNTKQFFLAKYGNNYVLDGWDIQTNEYFDYLEEFDIVYYANPYDSMVHDYHKISYTEGKKVLPIYISYGYDVGKTTTIQRLKSLELNLVWKYFVDTEYSYYDVKKYQLIHGRNAILAGYAKMDLLRNCDYNKKEKKRILITPHHTVNSKHLPLSNFIIYSNLIKRLPILFPNLEFVFRPHPLLFSVLINEGIWTSEEVSEYVEELENNGILYSYGGDYLQLFADCDAIINDCGSFAIEWLYTGKPGCFVYNDNLNDKLLTTLMKKAITEYTVAHCETDIIEFIRSIDQNGNRTARKMKPWVKNKIAINYPYVSEGIIQELYFLEDNEGTVYD